MYYCNFIFSMTIIFPFLTFGFFEKQMQQKQQECQERHRQLVSQKPSWKKYRTDTSARSRPKEQLMPIITMAKNNSIPQRATKHTVARLHHLQPMGKR